MCVPCILIIVVLFGWSPSIFLFPVWFPQWFIIYLVADYLDSPFVFVCFVLFFSLVIVFFSLIVSSQKMLDTISVFWFSMLVLWPSMLCPGECSMYIWKECVFWYFWMELSICMYLLCTWYVILGQHFLSNFFVLDDLFIDVSGVLKLLLLCVITGFFSYVHYILLYLFRCFCVDAYIFAVVLSSLTDPLVIM